jgi:hypothetical protein
MAATGDYSIIAVDKFILATRDSGYKGTESAIAELVDNALQAGSRRVSIHITTLPEDKAYPLRISVLDDGCGMDRKTLRQALRFGGTSRFNDRKGLGRYGMGLPNSSLSQARRVEVYTWRRPGTLLFCYLDVDEITNGEMTEIPEPRPGVMPTWAEKPRSQSGTLVLWTHCDRLDHRRASTIARKLATPLGRVFRYFLWDGVRIEIDGEPIVPVDPLYLRKCSSRNAGHLFGEPIEYDIEARGLNGTSAGTGKVVVTFSELPVHAWHDLPNEEKRQRGVTNGAGVSVVRANREIDYGWFFMGSKRRENYDDWWRCEIRFDPVLDEAFGITHTKQQIHPQDYVQEALSPDIETVAKALNGRVRNAHLEVRRADRTVEVERLASERDQLLKPLPKPGNTAQQETLLKTLAKRHPCIRDVSPTTGGGALQYRIVEDQVKDMSFYSYALNEGLLVLVLNPEHPFYRKFYKLLAENDSSEARKLRSMLDLLLLSAVRAEATATRESHRDALQQFRRIWSDNLSTFLNT